MNRQEFTTEVINRLTKKYGKEPWKDMIHIYEYPNGFTAFYQVTFDPGVSYTYNTDTGLWRSRPYENGVTDIPTP